MASEQTIVQTSSPASTQAQTKERGLTQLQGSGRPEIHQYFLLVASAGAPISLGARRAAKVGEEQADLEQGATSPGRVPRL